ncbi:MAG: hypothetical protein QM699_04275 [Amaricoccus sp.]|uniref:hypothetical protein n=1 Tax=Amaricoccus sp. TaxID=1872485 RepID=UPI0039E31584
MYQTIQVSSRVSVYGELVERLPDGQVVVRDGLNVYRGQPVAPFMMAQDSLGRLGTQADAR